MAIQNTLDLNWSDAGASILESLSRTEAVNQKLDVVVNTGVTDQAQVLSLTLADLKLLYMLSNCDLTLKTNSPGVNAVQTVSVTGTVSGGTFNYQGTRPDTNATTNVTGIAWNVSLAIFQSTVLDAIYGAGNTLATGGPLPGTPIVVNFQGALAAYPVVLPTINNASLTGGGTIGAVTTTAGVRWGDQKVFLAGEPLIWWDTALWNCPFAVDVANLYLSNASGQQATFQIRAVLSS